MTCKSQHVSVILLAQGGLMRLSESLGRAMALFSPLT